MCGLSCFRTDECHCTKILGVKICQRCNPRWECCKRIPDIPCETKKKLCEGLKEGVLKLLEEAMKKLNAANAAYEAAKATLHVLEEGVNAAKDGLKKAEDGVKAVNAEHALGIAANGLIHQFGLSGLLCIKRLCVDDALPISVIATGRFTGTITVGCFGLPEKSAGFNFDLHHPDKMARDVAGLLGGGNVDFKSLFKL